MNDWIGLGVIVLLGVLALVGLARLGTPRKEISVEEFEERARTGGHTRAGMFGLQEILDPKAARAVAVKQDLKHGYYNKKRVPGDGDEAGDKRASGGGEGDEGGSAGEVGGKLGAAESEERGDA